MANLCTCLVMEIQVLIEFGYNPEGPLLTVRTILPHGMIRLVCRHEGV
jgi:hypothetical protein